MVMITLYAKQKKRHRCTEQIFGLWEKARVGCFERTASKHVYYLGWNRSPAQVGCMRQVLGPGALGRPRGIGWRGRWEGGSGWGIHVTPWLIHVSVWQNPLQYCKVISLQLIKINEKKIVLSFCWKRSFSSQTFLDSLSLAQLNPQVPPAVKLFHLWISIYLVNVLCTCFVSTILPKAKERKNGNLSEG